jgi:hypothetical protein
MPATTLEQIPVRDLIWGRIRAEIAAYPGEPTYIDARSLAARLIARFRGSGLDADQVALEFHRIRRALRDRGNADVGIDRNLTRYSRQLRLVSRARKAGFS